MSSALAKTCPACQTRNKPKWEFCVRCGESLAGVSATSDGAKPDAKPAAARPRAARPSRASFLGTLIWILVLAAAGVGAVVWFFRAPEAKPAGQSIFSLPRKDIAPPPAKVVKGPGVAAFEEAQKRVAQGDLAGAVTFYVQALAEAPDNVSFRLTYVGCLEKLGNVEAALAELRTGIERPSATIEIGRKLAQLLQEKGRVDEAVAAYARALKMQPGDAASLKNVAGLLVDSGRAEQAIPYLRELVKGSPNDLNRRQQLGEALMASGQPTEAAGLFWHIVENMPDAVIARVWLAEAQARQGYADAAVKTVQDGLALDPMIPGLHRALGSMLEKAGKAKEAASAFRKYAELAPNAPDAQELRARASRLDPSGGSS